MGASNQTLTVFIDVIFLENLVLNYMILSLTDKIIKAKAKSLKILLGALIGAIYVVILIMVPGIKFYYTAAAKFLLSLLIIAIAFSPEKLKSFIKVLAVFYISTFIFGGAGFAFLYLTKSGGFVKNGMVYYFAKSPWIVIFFTVITVGIIVRVVMDVWQARQFKDKLCVPLKISFENRSIDIDALVDTGNSLCDPLSKMPVIVVEYVAICQLLPDDIKTIFDKKIENDLSSVTNIVSKSSWFSRFRLIPFSSLGRENGMLIGFKPDYILIGEEGSKNVFDVVIGIYNRSLSKNSRYRAILSPDLIG